MANPIIQGYLSDNSVDLAKRQKVMNALKAGQGEDQLASMISQKYGTKYGSSGQASTSNEPGRANLEAKAAKNIIGGITGLMKPDIGKAASAVTNMATQHEWTPPTEQEVKQYDEAHKPANYGILQPLRDATRGLRQDLDSKSADQFLEENPALKPVAAIADNPVSHELTRLGGSATMGAVEGLFNTASAVANFFNPINQYYDRMKQEHPEHAAEIQKLQDASVGGVLKNMGQGGSELADRGITESTGISKDSVSGNIGGAVGKFASMVPGLVAGGAAGKLVGGGKLGFGLESAIGTNAITAADEGRAANAGELVTGLAADGALKLIGKGVGAAKNSVAKIFSKAPENVQKEALRLGLHEKYANALDGLDDVQKAKGIEYLEAGVNKLKDPVNAPGVYDIAGKEVDDFVDQAKAFQQKLGEEVGKQKEKFVNVKVDAEPLKAQIKESLKSVGVSNIKALKSSDIGKNAQVMTMIKDVDNFLKSADKTYGTVNARKLEALTSQIDELTGQLKASGLQKTKANEVLVNIKKAINKSLGTASPEFGKVNTQYAKLTKELNKIKKGAEIPLGNGETVSNGAAFLRRTLGNADKKYTAGLKSMQKLANEYGLKMPGDLKTKALLADMAEKYTGTVAPQSLGGVTEMAVQAVPGKVGAVAQTLKDVQNYIKPTAKLQEKAEKIITALEKSITSGKSIRMAPKDASVLNELLKAVFKKQAVEGSISDQS